MLNHRTCRLGVLAVAASVVWAPGWSGRRATADGRYTRGEVILRGAAPYTESWEQMQRRDALLERQVRMGQRAPRAPRRAPIGRLEGVRRGTGLEEGFFSSPSRAPQSIGTSFAGISLTDQLAAGRGSIPPDTNGAIGPNDFMECINDSVAIYSRTGLRRSHVSLDAFFTVINGGITFPRNGSFDPRVIYDRRSGRWFALALEFGSPQLANNHMILAVSRTSDPSGTYDKYVIPVGVPNSGGTSFFTDYQTLGVDDNGLYSGMRIFPSSGNSFAKIVATPMAPLLAASPSLGSVTQFSNITDLFSSPQPAHNHSAAAPGDPAYIVASSATVFANINYRTITWSGGTPALSATTVLTTPAYNNPLNAPASGSTVNLDVGDDRMQMAMLRGSRLWCCRNVGVNASGGSAAADRTGCEWFELDAAGGTLGVIQNGRVFDPGGAPRFYFYPSIMVNGQGHAAMGFSGSMATEFAGAYFTGRLASDTPNTMGTVDLIRAGGAAYQNLGSGLNRWGDYSYTSLDPNDDMTLWTIQEYATTTTNRWGTQIAQLRSVAPTLTNPNGSGDQGALGVSLVLTGTGFYDPGAGFVNRLQVQLAGGAVNGISNYSVQFNSPTRATVTFDISGSATPGARDVILTNPDGQIARVNGGFQVLPSIANQIELSSIAYTARETDGSAVITLARQGNPANPASVQYATSDGSAVAPGDYQSTSGTLNFAANQTTATFNIPLVADRLLEGNETLDITLSGVMGLGASLGGVNMATLTITDDTSGPAPTSLAANVASAAEIRLTWQDNCENEEGFEIDRRSGGGAFLPLPDAPAGSTSFMDLTVVPGTVYTYRIRAFRGVNTSDDSNQASATITVLEFSALNYSASESDGQATITVVRNGDASVAGSVNFTTSNGRARAPDDYAAISGTLDFPPNISSRTFAVSLVVDRLLEGSEDVNLILTGATGTGIFPGARSAAFLTIADDTSLPAPDGLTATAISAGEIDLAWTDNCDNESGFQVERKTGAGAFTPLPPLGAGVTAFTDTGLSGGETYTYRVHAVSGPNRSDSSNEASATITVVQFTADVYPIVENQSSAVISVTRLGSTAGTASVNFAAVAGTAQSPADFTEVSGTLNFGPGETTQTFAVPLVGDNLLEGVETVDLSLSGVMGSAFAGSRLSARLDIADDVIAPAPRALQATAVTATQARLNWVDSCDNEDGFEIERKTENGNFLSLPNAPAGTTTILDDGLQAGTRYTYRVRAFRAAHRSANSNEAAVTIVSVDFALSAASVSEADGSVDIAVTRTSGAAGAAAVTLATQDGTAVAPEDYTPASVRLNFLPGQVAAMATISVRADRLLEGSETVQLILGSPSGSGVVIGPQGAAVLTITDDTALPSPGGLTATAISPSQVRLTWTDNCLNETAVEVERRVGNGAFVSLPNAPANATTTVDSDLSVGESYTYRVRAVRGAHRSDFSNEASTTITTVDFQAASVSVDERDGSVDVTVTRSGNLSGDATVSYATSDGTATAASDYITASGLMRFAPNQASASITVFLIDDNELEADETFMLTIGSPTGAGVVTGPQNTATITIVNDPVRPAPINLTAAAVGLSRVELAWTDRSASETDFIVERRRGMEAFTRIGTVINNGVRFTDTAAEQGVSLTYRVRATARGVDSVNSNEATVIIEGGGRAAVSTRRLNFGAVAIATSRTRTFTIRNRGQGVLVGSVDAVEDAFAAFAVVEGAGPFQLAPGELRRVTVRYSPSELGQQLDAITITTSDAARSSVQVGLRGKGVPGRL